MIAIAVDDEHWALDDLNEMLGRMPEISQVHPFGSCEEALSWAGGHRFDIAFLDINMRGMGGIELAKKLRELNRRCYIIFCTGFDRYMPEAFRDHANAYLMKPILPEQLQRELDYIKELNRPDALLTVHCFGRFEAFDSQGEPLRFHRNKTRELLAVLVDNRGAGLTPAELCSILWEDDADDRGSRNYLRQLVSDLRRALQEAGASVVLRDTTGGYAIDVSLVDCDYYRYLSDRAGTPHSREYMSQYSWAEPTNAWLQMQEIS